MSLQSDLITDLEEKLSKTSLPFTPISADEDQIHSKEIQNGNLYFATDSGRIYLDMMNERKSFGGQGVSILYASGTTDDIVEDTVDFTYYMNITHLDDKKADPKAGDLIINKDGRFFKILSYNEQTKKINMSLIAVSGTGGGGGGGSTGGSGSNIGLTCTGITPNAQIYIYGQEQKIEFTPTAKKDSVLTLTYIITSVATGETKTFPYSVYTDKKHPFDLGSKLFHGLNTLKVTVTGSNSGTTSLNYDSINAITLALRESKEFNPLAYAVDNDLVFNFIPVGEVKKTLKVYLNNAPNNSKDFNSTISNSQEAINVFAPIDKETEEVIHGVYSMKAVLSYSTGVGEIKTDPLTYEVAFVNSKETAPLIWFNKYPTTIVDHDRLSLQFMVYDPVNPLHTNVERFVNNTAISPLEDIAYSDTEWFTWNISNYKLGKNTFSLKCGSTTAEVVIYVEEDTIRDLEIVDNANLWLNLTTLDRSNKENKTSRERWEYHHKNNTTTSVQFNNFNWYNNGWIDDKESGNSILRISNGASIDIPLRVMNSEDLETSLTFEIRFKLRNVQKYSNLITVSSEVIGKNEYDEDIVKVTKNVSSTEGVWCKYNKNNIGMCLGTQEGFFKGSSAIASGRYKEDQMVTVSFVVEKRSLGNDYPLIYMYIDGVMCSIINYPDKETFNSLADSININSEYCDVDLYGIRVYKTALSSREIVKNYLADRNDAVLYDMNQIIKFDEKTNVPSIDYNAMIIYNEKHPDELLYPYAVLECVDKTEDKLPFIKGGKKYLNVTFVNPSLDRAYKNNEISGEDYLCGAPSFYAKNVQFDVQGTSSQGYPRRNYKGKFKKETNNSWVYTEGPLVGKEIGESNTYNGHKFKNYYMDNTFSESTFTWKADYMESSMTHNTGFASFVSGAYDHHPLEDYDDKIDVTNRRTTIYGFPMMVFQKTAKVDVNGEPIYEFIGRYNFNLDKGCNNVIGFKEKTKHPIIEGTFENDDGEIKPLDFEHVAECWELKHNQGGRVAFTKADFGETKTPPEEDPNKVMPLTVLEDFEYRYHFREDEIDDAIDLKGSYSGNQSKANDFLKDEIYCNLEKVVEWLASTNVNATGLGVSLPEPVTYGEYAYTIVENITADNFIPNIYYLKTKAGYKIAASYSEHINTYKEKGLTVDTYEPNTYYILNEDGAYVKTDLPYNKDTKYYELTQEEAVYYERKQVYYNLDNKEYRLAKFRNEFDQHFNKHYCAIYFIMTEFLVQYDSRGKNMMLASWGPQDWKKDSANNYILDESGKKIPADYIWYPIFYDIDTQLGVNNSGVPSWEYFVEPTKTNQFSTSGSVLWNNFYECFYTDITSEYINLRNNYLDYETLNGYYSYNPTEIIYTGLDGENHNSYAMRGHRPISVINVDQYYKYIAPTFTGYLNTKGETAFDQGRRFYCLQGNRDLHRELFLRNRFNFMDSVWLGGVYSPEGVKQEFQIRCNANLYAVGGTANTSDNYLDTTVNEPPAGFLLKPYPQPLDSNWTWNITPYLSQYVSLRFDEILQGNPVKYSDTTISYMATDMTEEMYEPGIYYTAEEVSKEDGSSEIRYTVSMLPYNKDVQYYVLTTAPVVINVNADKQKEVRESPSLSQQLFYMGGAEYISSLGDISLKYPDEIYLTELKRLKDIRLGNDNKEYYNNALTTVEFGAGAKTPNGDENPSAKRLLESVVLTGVTSIDKAYDFTGSEKLKEFRALNTGLLGASFADGVQLETVHLPKSVTAINFTEPVALTKLLTSSNPEVDEKGAVKVDHNGYNIYPKGLYIEGVTDNTDNTTNINAYSIIGGKMGYSSYELLKRLVEIKQAMQMSSASNKKLSVKLENVDWTPYRLVASGEEIQSGVRYKKITDNSTLENYTPGDNWDKDTLDQLIYEVDEAKEAQMGILTNLDLLDLFVSEDNLSNLEQNYFTNPDSGGEISYPTISGNIYVNNDENNPISDYKIKTFYNEKYRDLSILVKNVIPAYTSKFVEITDEGQTKVLDTIKYDPNQSYVVTASSVKPSKLHNDFLGWSLTPNPEITNADGSLNEDKLAAAILDKDEFAALTFNENKTTIIFYAVYHDTNYTISFYDNAPNAADKYFQPIVLPYGSPITEPTVIPYRGEEEKLLEAHRRIVFKGWTTESEKAGIVSLTDLPTIQVNLNDYSADKDHDFYALFIEESVYDNATDFKYFNIVDGVINIKEEYRKGLKGRITLPSIDKNDNIITTVGDFGDMPYITHIFFKPDSAYTTVKKNAFARNDNSYTPALDMVELKNTVTTIEYGAFYNQTKLSSITMDGVTYIGDNAFMQQYGRGALLMAALPTNLTYLGNNAFYNCGEGISINSIPSGVEKIGNACFYYCVNVTISEFGSDSSDSKLHTIGRDAFGLSPSNTGANRQIEKIRLYPSVTTIESGAFSNYGKQTLSTDGSKHGVIAVITEGMDTANFSQDSGILSYEFD